MSRFDVKSFCSPPDPELICGICMNVLDEPKETPCRHVFCKLCIFTALGTKRRCPMCRTRCKIHDLRSVLPLVQNLLNKLPMRCKNYRGKDILTSCKQVVKKEYYLDHIKKCEFAYIDCPFKGCKALVLRGKKSDHIASCEYRPVTCTKGCDTQYRWKDRSSHSCIKALKKVVKELQEEKKILQERVKHWTEISMRGSHSATRAIESSNEAFEFHSRWFSLQDNPRRGNSFNPQDDSAVHQRSARHTSSETRASTSHQDRNISSTSRRVSSDNNEFEGGRRRSAWGVFGFGSTADAGPAESNAQEDLYNSYGPPVVDMNEEDLHANYALENAEANDNLINEPVPQRDNEATPIINISSSAHHSLEQEEHDYEFAEEVNDEEFPEDSYHDYEELYDSYGEDVSEEYPYTWPDEAYGAAGNEALDTEGNENDYGGNDILYTSPSINSNERFEEALQQHYSDPEEERPINLQSESSLASDGNQTSGVGNTEAAQGNDVGQGSDEGRCEESVPRSTGFTTISFSGSGQRRHREYGSGQDEEEGPSKRPRTDADTSDETSGSGSVRADSVTSVNEHVQTAVSNLPLTEPTGISHSIAAPGGERRMSARLQGLTPSPSTIPNVAIPLSTAELLERYAASEEEESDDPSWDSDED